MVQSCPYGMSETHHVLEDSGSMFRNPRARDLQLHKARIPQIANTDLGSSICMDIAEEMPKPARVGGRYGHLRMREHVTVG
jgi:hypothetical protein